MTVPLQYRAASWIARIQTPAPEVFIPAHGALPVIFNTLAIRPSVH
jgi:hypothetical protein